MKQQELFKGRDRRNKGWFWMDNDYLNGYAKIFGAVGTAIYVSLCRHANNETQKCFPAMDLMAEELGISRNTISKYIKLFEKKHLISIDKERDYKTKKWLNNVYTLLDKDEWDSHAQIVDMGSHAQLVNEPCTTDSKSHAQLLGNKETNINKTNIKETNIAGQSPAEIIQIINSFEGINPSFNSWYGNKTQRASAKWLLDNFGLEDVLQKISKLQKINSMPYAPISTTPYQLQTNMAKIMAFIEQNKNKALSKVRGLEV